MGCYSDKNYRGAFSTEAPTEKMKILELKKIKFESLSTLGSLTVAGKDGKVYHMYTCICMQSVFFEETWQIRTSWMEFIFLTNLPCKLITKRRNFHLQKTINLLHDEVIITICELSNKDSDLRTNCKPNVDLLKFRINSFHPPKICITTFW